MYGLSRGHRHISALVGICIISSFSLTPEPVLARPVQILVQPEGAQASSMVRGVQMVVSQAPESEIWMLTPEPAEDGRLRISLMIANLSSQAVNIGPENVTATSLLLVPYDELIDEQRRREGRRKFGNFLAKLGNSMAAADAGTSYGSFSYSGHSAYGSHFSGGGTVTTYNPYIQRQALAEAKAENAERTERMYASFAADRSALGVNLRTTTLYPQQEIRTRLTFEIPRGLRKGAKSGEFSLTITIGSDQHILKGFVGPVGTLPVIVAKPSSVSESVTSRLANASGVGGAAQPRSLNPASASIAPPRQSGIQGIQQSARVAAPTVDPNMVSIQGYTRGYYTGQPDSLAILAKQGFAPAQYELGTMYELGKGVTQDNAEAVRLYRLAATQDHRDAQTSLGWMYEKGLGVKRNVSEAKKYYGMAAKGGDKIAQERLRDLQGSNL